MLLEALLSKLPACKIYPKVIKQIDTNWQQNYLILSIWISKNVHPSQLEYFGFDILGWYRIVHSYNN